ncbi:LGFP repeat-containing protein [Pseudonocardia sp. CA-107938]|uniref:LGFP repeat-containing protein n=1 Tax=Pseudonocardia sp. CA-107938 TaxID=3240021 RepID=UPI003D91CBEA
MSIRTRIGALALTVMAALTVTLFATGTASAATCAIPSAGDIGARWVQLGGGDGVLGCPTGPEKDLPDGAKGRQQFFQNGHVVVSPDQGSHMVTVAYRQGNRAFFTWGYTNPFSYDLFQVRWGTTTEAGIWKRPNRQIEFKDADGGHRQSGSWFLDRTSATPTMYSFQVQGSDRSWGNTTCRQGFTYPVHVRV